MIFTQKSYKQHLRNRVAERFTLPSQTVPDMAMTLQELVQRFVQGQHVETFHPHYDGDGDLPADIERLDALERLDLARNIRAGIAHHQRGLNVLPDNKSEKSSDQPGESEQAAEK